MEVVAIILAAGKGTRMKSELPKVFHRISGQPMLEFVIETASKVGVDKTFLVVGHKGDMVKKNFKKLHINFVEQKPQLGTGHAVMQVRPQLKKFKGMVLVLSGDTPLLTSETLKNLMDTHIENNASATVLTAELQNPAGYGRIIRSRHGAVERIVEHKDATSKELKIKEINTGTYCFQAKALFEALAEIKPENVQKEYYLTDVISVLKEKGLSVFACRTGSSEEALGINTRRELARAEKIFQRRMAQ